MSTVYLQGIGQMTAASQATIRQAQGMRNGNSNGARRSRRKAKTTSGGPRKVKARAGGAKRPKKFVKGSKEAKAYMAKIRKLRK